MKITSIQNDLFRVPLPTVLSDSTHGEISYFELITTRLRCDGGEEGLGYTYTVGTGGSAIRALIEYDLVPILIGSDPREIEKIWKRMWWHLHYVGRGGIASFAISAIDIALWDLKSRVANEPLWKFLGGHQNRVAAYAGGIDLQFTLEALCEQTRKFINLGFHSIKMKVGQPHLSEDIARVSKVRDILGPGIPLMLDANMQWTVDEAIRAAKALSDFDIFWLEEPTIPDDIEGHARISREGGLPIATGENMHTLYEFQQMITRGGISFPEPDISNVGGITVWMKVAHLAEANNLKVTSHGVHDLHVHLLAAVPNASFLEAHGFGLDRFLKHPLQLENGEAIAPDRNGHGVDLDWDALESYRNY